MSETGLTEVQQNGYLENTSPTSAIFTRHRRNLTIRFTKRPTPRCGLRRAVGHVTRCATGEKTSTNSRNPCALGNEKPADFIGNTGSELFGSRESILPPEGSIFRGLFSYSANDQNLFSWWQQWL